MRSERALLIGVIFIACVAVAFFLNSAKQHRISKSAEASNTTATAPVAGSASATSASGTLASNSPGSLSGPLVSFSFDDGWQSQYDNALPILEKAGFKGTFYIISTRVGTSLHMTRSELLQMEADGNEIGDHTRTHPDLSKLTDANAEEQIAGARQDLLALGFHDISTFAYPYGGHNDSTPGLVREAGLSGARSSRIGINSDEEDPYLLLSYHLTASTTLADAEKEIDTAIAQKQWLIFEGHHINEHTDDNISSSFLAQIVAYVKEKHIRVVTVRGGLAFLKK